MADVLVSDDELRMLRMRAGTLPDARDADCEPVLVPIPDWLMETPGAIYDFDPAHPEYGIDARGRKCLRLDECIVPAVLALWEARIVTRSCCCGHGNGWGLISVLPSCAPARS